jgi:hypothetical protein
MALSSYNIDFKKVVTMLLAGIWRRVRRIAWLTAALKPLANIHERFISIVNAKREEVKWNGQTILLQALLVRKFGGGITIVNHILELNGAFVGEDQDTSFFVGQNNDNEQYIDVTYSIEGYNFTVYVPSSISFVPTQMAAYINKYKMFGTTYNIIIV